MSDNTCRKCYHTDPTDNLYGICKECEAEQDLDAPTGCDHFTETKPETQEAITVFYIESSCEGKPEPDIIHTLTSAETNIVKQWELVSRKPCFRPEYMDKESYNKVRDYNGFWASCKTICNDSTRRSGREPQRCPQCFQEKPQEAPEHTINTIMVKTWEDIYGTYEKAKEARQDLLHQRLQNKILNLTIRARHAERKLAAAE